MQGIWVAAEWRRRGVGSRLNAAIIAAGGIATNELVWSRPMSDGATALGRKLVVASRMRVP